MTSASGGGSQKQMQQGKLHVLYSSGAECGQGDRGSKNPTFANVMCGYSLASGCGLPTFTIAQRLFGDWPSPASLPKTIKGPVSMRSWRLQKKQEGNGPRDLQQIGQPNLGCSHLMLSQQIHTSDLFLLQTSNCIRITDSFERIRAAGVQKVCLKGAHRGEKTVAGMSDTY